jgi:hypothetical protein
MMMMKICKIIISYFGLLLVTFLLLYIIVSPMVQDAYKKGYERGVSENCPDVMKMISDNEQFPYIINNFTLSKPAGNQS